MPNPSSPDLKATAEEVLTPWLQKHAKFCDDPDCFQCATARLASAALGVGEEMERLKERLQASEHLRHDMDAALVRAGLRFNEELARGDTQSRDITALHRIIADRQERGTEALIRAEASEAREKALREALERAERKLSAYVGVCKGDKELTDTVLPMARAALAAHTGEPKP